MMTQKQAEDALHISDGASNARGIARALVESIDVDTEGGETYSPATRLMADQLCWVMFHRQLYGTTVFEEQDWFDDRNACRQVAGLA